MSSQDKTSKGPGPKLLSLAPEVVENVIKQVSNRRDLSNARLVCKELDKHATKELFKDVFVSPLEEHVSTWNSINQDDTIRQIPRHAIIHTQSNVEEDSFRDNSDEAEGIGEDFEAALAKLLRFPNLDSVEIGFTPECLGERNDSWWEHVVEDVPRRKKLLTLIFRAIKDRAANKENRPIRKLTITNLQNCPIPDFTSSDLFRDVMAQLDELHISLTQEYNEHGPDHDYSRVELQTFPAYFVSDWLQPISGNLKALSIYSRSDNWGPFPGYFDASGLSFPRLETLALGYYTLAHDNDMDWILSIKSLKKLILHNCMIASWLRFDPEIMPEWNVRTHDWTPLSGEEDDDWPQFSYSGTWSMNLDRIASSLPNLTSFGFDQGSSHPWRDEGYYDIRNRDDCGVRIFPKRYVVFDHGILPTHWPEANEEGELESWLDDGWPRDVHQETLEEDQKSLDKLLEKLRERR
jgi:hypothetical protein